jgi:type IV secretion system protein VirB9
MKSQQSNHRRRALMAAACAVIASATPCAFAQTVQMYEYQPDRIYPVRAGLGISTQIELSHHGNW